MPATQHIGLYGGAFDPPHHAHVALARMAIQQLRLHTLYIVPTGQPWMKQRQLTPARHRLRMAQLAFAALPRATVSDCEVQRPGTSYTFDTWQQVQQQWLQQHAQPVSHLRCYLVLGQDLLPGLPQWHRAQELFAHVEVAVMPRPDSSNPPAAVPTLPPAVQQALPALRATWLTAAAPHSISSISSTHIRHGLAQQQPHAQARLQWLHNLVPDAVAQYIVQHHLYQHTDPL